MSIEVPDGYRHWPHDPAEDHIGPFFYRPLGNGRVLTRCRVQAHHCNTYGSVHGGVLMAFADYTLCLAAIESEADAVVTVSATCDFVAAARAGDVLDGEGELTRLGGSLAFTRAVLRSGDRVVMTASGVIKRLNKPAG
jgi:uncharacterized protein (TIGR00369 family)